MPRSSRLTLLAAIAAVSLPAIAQENLATLETSRPQALDPGAVARAQDKFARAFATTLAFETALHRQGYDADGWRRDMLAALMNTDIAAYEQVADTADPGEALRRARSATGTAAAGSQAKSLGTYTSDLIFVPISPCRILDTRLGTPIPARQVATFAYGATNVGAGNCSVSGQIPGGAANPAAEAVNVTVDETGLTGFAIGSFVAIYSQGSAPGASFMNFGPGQVIANAGIVPITQATGQFSVRANAPVNVIIDVYGLFLPPQATALECTDTTKVTGNIPASDEITLTGGTCPATYTAVGGGCFGGSTADRYLEEATLNVHGQWFCRFKDQSSTSYEVASVTHCCRVPGRGE